MAQDGDKHVVPLEKIDKHLPHEKEQQATNKHQPQTGTTKVDGISIDEIDHQKRKTFRENCLYYLCCGCIRDAYTDVKPK